MDACRLAAASVPVGEQGCGKSGKRPVAADLGVGLLLFCLLVFIGVSISRDIWLSHV